MFLYEFFQVGPAEHVECLQVTARVGLHGPGPAPNLRIRRIRQAEQLRRERRAELGVVFEVE